MSGEDGLHPGPLPGMPGAQAAPPPAEGSPGTATTGSGGFSVDLDRAPQAIADLRAAADVLRDEAKKAWSLARIRPPGLDAVSADAVRIMAEAAVGEQGSLRLALEGAADRFESRALTSHLPIFAGHMKTHRRGFCRQEGGAASARGALV